MGKLHVEAEQTTRAAPEIVWALVSDAMTYPRWGPWREAGYQSRGDTSPRGPGAGYWLRSSRRYGLRYPVSVEKILDAEQGRHLAYAVIDGIPVRNYRADITLEPAAGGTRIHWAASWDRTLAGRLVHRSLRKLYPQIVARLAAEAEKEAAEKEAVAKQAAAGPGQSAPPAR
jgi:uncharacterized protein YndB with AHSA1/START domain